MHAEYTVHIKDYFNANCENTRFTISHGGKTFFNI